jgi:hypothetical protein
MTSILASTSGKSISSIDTIKTADHQIDEPNATATNPSLLRASTTSTSTPPPKLPTTKSIDIDRSSDRSSKDTESQRKIGKKRDLANLNDLFVSVLPSFQMQEKDKLKKKLRENVDEQTQEVSMYVDTHEFILIYIILRCVLWKYMLIKCYMYIYIYIYVCIYIHICIYTYLYLNFYRYMCIYIYIYICINVCKYFHE